MEDDLLYVMDIIVSQCNAQWKARGCSFIFKIWTLVQRRLGKQNKKKKTRSKDEVINL